MLEPPKGMDDLLPEDARLMRFLKETAYELFELYGYDEVDTPTVEYYDLFALKSGEELRERMFTFEDAHGRKLVLRPEMTAPVARLVAGKMSRRPMPLRLGYVSDCYRLDEPQWGRRRRFYHAGFELFGSSAPAADVEILRIARDYFEKVGLGNAYFKIGHVGILRSIMRAGKVEEDVQDAVLSLLDRNRLGDALSLLRSAGAEESIVELLYEMSKVEPAEFHKLRRPIEDLLSVIEDARRLLANLEEIIGLFLESAPKEVRSIYYPTFARGLAYYTGMIFEVYVPGVSIALAGGGRYDGLVRLFGGRDVPGVGTAIGLTRILQYLSEGERRSAPMKGPSVYVTALGGRELRVRAMKIASALRDNGIAVEEDVTDRRLSDALSYAEKRGVRYVIILGGIEASRGTVTIKDLQSRTQVEVPLDPKSIIDAMRGSAG